MISLSTGGPLVLEISRRESERALSAGISTEPAGIRHLGAGKKKQVSTEEVYNCSGRFRALPPHVPDSPEPFHPFQSNMEILVDIGEKLLGSIKCIMVHFHSVDQSRVSPGARDQLHYAENKHLVKPTSFPSAGHDGACT
jgi:hypothetical protein